MNINYKFVVQVAVLTIIFSLEWIFPYFEQRKGRLRHDINNLVISAVNGLIGAIIFSALIVFAADYSYRESIGLLHNFNLSSGARVVLAVILFDLWMYGWHRINHVVPFLWKFHRMHHSDPAMDVTTGLRFHPGEVILSSSARMIVVGLLGLHVYELVIYEALSQIVVLFHHSNLKISDRFDRLFRLFFVSPNMHKIHHSDIQLETDSNYASFLSIWDRLFGSYRERERYDQINYGLKEFHTEEDLSLRGMVKTPFLKR